MNQNTKTLIKYRLERARESLEDARHLFGGGSLYATVNRIYYSMFYSVNALLLTKNLSSAKHSGVRALFNKEFVRTGEVDKDTGRFYSEIFEKRQKGDYKDFVEFKREEVAIWLKRAEEFVNSIEEAILRALGN